MESLAQWLVDHLVLGVLVMTRLSTLLMAMPAVGVGVPKRVRAFLALLMTILLLPPVASGTEVASLPQIDNLIDLTIAIAQEGLIGLLIGATIQLIITGLQLGGEAITSTGGMQLGDAVDPTTSSSMPSVADRKRTQDKFLALAKERGYKKGRLGGAIIHIPEGTDIM